MTKKITDLINDKLRQDYAVAVGTEMHTHMQNIFFDSDGTAHGNSNIVARISGNNELIEYMGPLSKTEVPIAGYIDGRFISRRVDRLYVNKETKTVVVIDYKTDLDKERFRPEYVRQLTEYRKLLSDIYPGFSIKCKILWTNDFTLENII